MKYYESKKNDNKRRKVVLEDDSSVGGIKIVFQKPITVNVINFSGGNLRLQLVWNISYIQMEVSDGEQWLTCASEYYILTGPY